jgi:hypothetical protein
MPTSRNTHPEINIAQPKIIPTSRETPGLDGAVVSPYSFRGYGEVEHTPGVRAVRWTFWADRNAIRSAGRISMANTSCVPRTITAGTTAAANCTLSISYRSAQQSQCVCVAPGICHGLDLLVDIHHHLVRLVSVRRSICTNAICRSSIGLNLTFWTSLARVA